MSAYSQDHHASEFSGAVALNNIGVTLLERGCFRHGLETLQDGISVMKQLFRDQQSRSTSQEIDDQETIRMKDSSPPTNSSSTQSYSSQLKESTPAKLHRATCKLLQSQTASFKNQDLDLVVLSYQSTGLQDVLDQLGHSPCTSKYLCIRMDDSNILADYTTDGSPDIESAILLFNFGVAHVLLSHTQRRRQPVLENAHHILRLASDIIARRSQGCHDNHLDETCLLQLGLAVLHGIIQVLVESGLDDQAAQVFDRYTNVRTVLERVQHLSQWLSSCLVSAPAA